MTKKPHEILNEIIINQDNWSIEAYRSILHVVEGIIEKKGRA